MAIRSPIFLPPLKEPADLQPLVEKALEGLTFETASAFGELIVMVPAASVVEAAKRLKGGNDLKMDYVRCLSGVDLPEGFEVVYHLSSVSERHNMVLKARVSKEDPRLPSVMGVWKGADWHEREAAEMFGIDFEGHPHLVTLLLVDGFEGHPLLKSYKLDDIPADVIPPNVREANG